MLSLFLLTSELTDLFLLQTFPQFPAPFFIFALQGLSELTLHNILAAFSISIFYPLSTVLIFLFCLKVIKPKHYVLVFASVCVNFILLVSNALLISFSAKGDLELAVILTIPSLLFFAYYFVQNKAGK